MNINIINENDFHIKPFEQHITKNNSLINILDNNQFLLKSLKSFGMFDSDIIMESNDSQKYSIIEEYNQNLEITNHCSMKDYSMINLNKGFSLKMDSEVMNVRIDDNNKFIALGMMNGNLGIVDITTSQLKYILQTSPNKLSISSLRWKPDNDCDIITAVNAEGSITSFNLSNNKQRYKIDKKGQQLLAMDYDLNGDQFLIGDNKGNIYLINEHTQKDVQTFSSANFFNHGHSNRIFSLKFLPDNPFLFLSGGWDGMVFLWDIRDKKPQKHLIVPQISGDSLDYKNGNVLVGSYNSKNPISLFSLSKGEKIIDIKPNFDSETLQMSVYSCQFSPIKNNMTIFACSSKPNCLRVYEKRKGKQDEYFHSWSVDGFEQGLYSMHVSQNKKIIALGCADKSLTVINANSFE